MKNSLKNILFELVLLLAVIGTFLISGSADDKPVPFVTIGDDTVPGGIKVVKSVRPKEGEIGTYIVDFTITGKSVVSTKPICSIIILDASNSMDYPDSKWPNAKRAVAKYSKVLHNQNPDNQFVIATFNSPSRFTFYDYNNKQDTSTASFSKNIITYNSLSKIKTESGTYLYDAMKETIDAVTIPSGCTPVMTIISDGDARDYRANPNTASGKDANDVAALFAIRATNDQICEASSTLFGCRYQLDNYKSKFLLDLQSRMDIFTIGYDLDSLANAHATTRAKEILRNIATKDSNFITASIDDIEDELDVIGKSVSAAAEGASLVETPNSPIFTLSTGNGEVQLNPINETEQLISYEIKIDKNLPTGIYPTNDVTKTKIQLPDGTVLVDINQSPSVLWQKPDYDIYYHYEQLIDDGTGITYKDKKYNEVKDTRGKFSGLIDEIINVNPYKTYGSLPGFSYLESVQSPTKLVFGANNRLDIYYTRNSYPYRIEYYYENDNNEFIIDNNETITGTLPYGTEVSYTDYTVPSREKYVFDADRLTPSDGTITVSENVNNNVIKVYYKRIYDLEIIKQVKKYNEDTVLNPKDNFNFKIEFTDKDNNKIDGTYQYEKNGTLQDDLLVFVNGVANITLKSNESIKILNLEKGLKYKITETTNEGYIVEVKDSSNVVKTTNKYESIINGDSEVTYINIYGCELSEAGSSMGLLLTIMAMFFFSAPIINKAYSFNIDRCISRHLND